MARTPRKIETPGDTVTPAPDAKTATVRSRVKKLLDEKTEAAEVRATPEMYCGFPVLERDGDWLRLPQGWTKERK